MVRLNMIKYLTYPAGMGYLSLPQFVYYLSLCLPVGDDEIRSCWLCIQGIKDTDTQLVSMLTHRGVSLHETPYARMRLYCNVPPLDKTL